MEVFKSYLTKIKFPSYSELRSGEFFRKIKERDEKATKDYLHHFENKLVYVQEVLIWTNVQRSVVWLVASQLFLYQFCLSSTPILSTTAQLMLIGYLYTIFTQKLWPVIRIPEEQTPQDIEVWTDVHPDTLSAPELQQLVQKSKQKIIQIYNGLWLLRSDDPLRFCITMSTFFIATAILGIKVSTPMLIHSVALLAFLLPPLLIHLSRNEHILPVLLLFGEIIISLANFIIYHGNKIVPKETHDLDEFMPAEESIATTDPLEITQSSHKLQDDVDYLECQLVPDDSIPSHEDPDLDLSSRKALMIQESQLLPSTSTIDHSLSDDDDDIMIAQTPAKLISFTDTSDDDDEFSLRGLPAPAVGREECSPVVQSAVVTSSSSLNSLGSSLVAASAFLPSVNSATAYLPSVNQVLGSLVSNVEEPPANGHRKSYRSGNSEASLDDFELISEDDLQKESQNELLD